MTTPSFTSALDVPMDEIERPKPIPTGSYIAQIVGLPQSRDVNVKGEERETLNINMKLVAPQQLDNPEAMTDYGDLSAARPLQRMFWFSKPSATAEELWGFRQFVVNTLKIDTAGKSVKQVCAEMAGKQLLVTIGHTTGIDKNTQEAVIYSNITATAAL